MAHSIGESFRGVGDSWYGAVRPLAGVDGLGDEGSLAGDGAAVGDPVGVVLWGGVVGTAFGGGTGFGEGIGVAPGRSCPIPAARSSELGTRKTPSSVSTVT